MLFGEKKNPTGDLATAADPLQLHLQRAAEETPAKMRERYLQYLANNKASFSGGTPLSSALAQKMQQQGAEQQGDIVGAAQRGAPLDYAERMQESQGLSDMRQRRIMAEVAAEKQRAAERKAAKKARKGGFLSTAGAIGGAALGNMLAPGVGGAAGAYIGGGIGGAVGGS